MKLIGIATGCLTIPTIELSFLVKTGMYFLKIVVYIVVKETYKKLNNKPKIHDLNGT